MSDYERYPDVQYPSIDIALKATDGTPALGLTAFNIAASYHMQGTPLLTLPLFDLTTVDDVWTEGGFIELDPNYWPGVYRLDLPNSFLTAFPDVSLSIVGQPIAPRFVTIAIIRPDETPDQPGVVFADIRYINGVRMNGGGVDGDEFQP